MKTKIYWLVFQVVFAVVLLFAPLPQARASQITDELKATIDQVILYVKDESLKKDPKKRRHLIRKTIEKRFNYKQMVKRSLARNWKKRTSEEKKVFVGLFKRLLENSYANKIESYRDEKINYIGEIVKGKYALVKTEIVRKDATILVDYKMIKENGRWLVYDFVVEGVSMVRNYRSQFTKIIRKDSYKVLVEKMTEKIQDLELENKTPSSEKL